MLAFANLSDRWLDLIQKIGLSVLFVIVTIIGCQLLVGSVARFGKRFSLSDSLVHAAQRLLRWSAVVVAGILALQAFGVLNNAWAALTGILALVGVGFVAVWSVLSNAFCSIILMVSQPFKMGDRLRIPSDGLEGTVVDLGLIFTTLKDGDNHLRIPNNMFFQKVLVLIGPASAPQAKAEANDATAEA